MRIRARVNVIQFQAWAPKSGSFNIIPLFFEGSRNTIKSQTFKIVLPICAKSNKDV